MIFAHDTTVALRGAAALVNTAAALPTDTDDLTTVEDLDAFFDQWGWTGGHDRDAHELEAVRALRPRLRSLWFATPDEAVRTVNTLLAEAHALPQLVRHGEWSWHLHATPADAPLATRMAVEAAMAFVDVVRGDELDRLRVCEFPGCGNRAAVTAYRARKAAARQG